MQHARIDPDKEVGGGHQAHGEIQGQPEHRKDAVAVGPGVEPLVAHSDDPGHEIGVRRQKSVQHIDEPGDGPPLLGPIGIGVHDAWHRRGIGNALMTELLDLADNWLGLRRVELHVFADNHAALALYRKFGFEIEAHQRGAVLRRGVLIDCYFMARLREAAPWTSTPSAANTAAE